MAVEVVVEKLTKVFKPSIVALRDVEFRIRPGEFFVILGPSGSGKTTLLRIIAGLDVPSKGRVRIGDIVVVDAEQGIYVEPKRRNVGMVFQNWALYPHMTAYDNIAFPLRIKGLSRGEIDRRVKEVSEALGILELLDRKPSHMSGGQQQRVALARALAKHPDVLLLDEPFSNLDARVRVTAREFVKEIQKEFSITTILVTHDQADAFAVGDRVMVLRRGVIQQLDTPIKLYEEPANMFVANFIGDPPMNLLRLNRGSLILKGLGLADKALSQEELVVGIRPDDAYASLSGRGLIEGKVALVEYAGSRRYAKVVLGDGSSIKALASDEVHEGSIVKLKFRKIHVFSITGERLLTVEPGLEEAREN